LVVGNHEALAIVVDRYQRLVFTIAFRIVHDKGEAEDLVQDIFLLIFRKVKLFDASKGIFKVWLLRCAYTSSMNRRDHLERRRFYSTVELDEVGPLAVPRADLFDGSLTEHEATRFVGQALDTLNPNQRKAIDLIALEGMTLEEAAHTMGYSLAATRNYYYRGIMALRTFNSNQTHSSVGQCVHALAAGNGKREVPHLKARTA
jgi:RNA polymerase sigma-70 factor (ECF subfamily)